MRQRLLTRWTLLVAHGFFKFLLCLAWNFEFAKGIERRGDRRIVMDRLERNAHRWCRIGNLDGYILRIITVALRVNGIGPWIDFSELEPASVVRLQLLNLSCSLEQTHQDRSCDAVAGHDFALDVELLSGDEDTDQD